MRRLILGTAGHIDHGKTALVRALTGVDTDRLPDEKRRGITIDLGFAALATEAGVRFGIVDVPGHEGFVRNMLAGATGIDVGLLVVAADEGVMPQTREHLAILDLLGVRSLVVAVTKADLVDPEWLELVADDVRQALTGTACAAAPLIAVSARTGQGLAELVEAIIAAADRTGDRPVDDLFRLPVDRSFTVHGTGTVVTGTVWSGAAGRDDVLRVLPGEAVARVRGVESHGEPRDRVEAGERAALALAGIERERVGRGATLVQGDGWQSASMITGRVRMLADAEPLRNRRRLRFHLGTAEVLGRAVLLDGEEIAPGAEGRVQFRLEEPVVARAGDRFVIRAYSPAHTIGGGTVIEPAAPKRKRLTAEDAARLDRLAAPDPHAALDAAVRMAGPAGLMVHRLPVAAPVRAPVADAWLAAGGALRTGPLAVHPEALAAVRDLLLTTLTDHHRREPLLSGMDLQELRQAAPRGTAPQVLDLAIRTLTADGRTVVEGSTIRIADHRPTPDAAQAPRIERLQGAIDAAGLAAPSPAELPAEVGADPDLRRFLGWLEREGRIVGIPDDRWIGAAHLGQATALLKRELGGRKNLSASDFRSVLPVTRKYLIPLLEHLDRTGKTRRTGDLREVPGG